MAEEEEEKVEIIEPEEVPFHKHREDGSPRISYKDLEDTPVSIVRTVTSVDLSGAATTLICLHTEKKVQLIKVYLLYTEASSADAGVVVKIGKESDDDYFYTGTSEVSKALWYVKDVTLLQTLLDGGDTLLFYSAGSKTGTGEIMLVVEYKII